jgi:hypothetical protein
MLLNGIGDRFLAVGRGADNSNIGGSVEEGGQPSPHQRVVIDNEHSNGSGMRNFHSHSQPNRYLSLWRKKSAVAPTQQNRDTPGAAGRGSPRG